jgi:hypothetical protein
MKTWEKIYWGTILALLVLVLISIATGKGSIKAEIRGSDYSQQKGKAILYYSLICLGFWGLIWLIVKVLTGGFSSSKR